MSLFAIADLHLSLGVDKPMDVFPGWENYVARLTENWRREVRPEDTVVIAGKGHETGQYVAGKRFAYNERAAIRHIIAVLEESRQFLPK